MTVKKKKNYSSGESLAELLVASLIISLAMIMLFSGLKVGTDMMHTSRDQYQQYNGAANDYEEAQASYASEYYSIQSIPIPSSFTFNKNWMNPRK